MRNRHVQMLTPKRDRSSQGDTRADSPVGEGGRSGGIGTDLVLPDRTILDRSVGRSGGIYPRIKWQRPINGFLPICRARLTIRRDYNARRKDPRAFAQSYLTSSRRSALSSLPFPLCLSPPGTRSRLYAYVSVRCTVIGNPVR